MTMFLGVTVAALVLGLLAVRHWHQRTTNDLGSMSTQWLAEYNSQHP